MQRRYLYLKDKTVFAAAIQKMFSAIDNPRYIIIKQDGIAGIGLFSMYSLIRI